MRLFSRFFAVLFLCQCSFMNAFGDCLDRAQFLQSVGMWPSLQNVQSLIPLIADLPYWRVEHGGQITSLAPSPSLNSLGSSLTDAPVQFSIIYGATACSTELLYGTSDGLLSMLGSSQVDPNTTRMDFQFQSSLAGQAQIELTLRDTGSTAVLMEAVLVVNVLAPTGVPPEIASFTASPGSINAGQPAELTWSTHFAVSAEIDPEPGTVPVSGSRVVYPSTTTVYTLNVEGTLGQEQSTVTVEVQPPLPTVHFAGFPLTIESGKPAQLSWTSEHADSCSLDQGIGSIDLDGDQLVTPGSTTTYTLTALNQTGSAQASVTLTVIPGPTALILTDCPSTAMTTLDSVSLTVLLDDPTLGLVDVTTPLKGTFYDSSDEAVLRVSQVGRLLPRSNGTAVITAKKRQPFR